MKIKKIAIISVAVLALSVLLLKDWKKEESSVEKNQVDSKTDRSNLTQQRKPEVGHTRGEYLKKVARDWETVPNYEVNQRMVLKGQVVDEEGNALEEANINAEWNYRGSIKRIKKTYTTNERGFFQIDDEDAISDRLSIETISLDGYIWIKSLGKSRFEYGDPHDEDFYTPFFDGNPTFTLFNLSKANPLYQPRRVKRMSPVVQSGQFIDFPLSQDQNLKNLRVTPLIKNTGSRTHYPWSIKIEGLDGTRLNRATERGRVEGAPIAPEDGYKNDIVVEYKGDEVDWRRNITFEFYYRLSDMTYGKCTIKTVPKLHHGSEKMLVSVKYDYNPTGSKVLVYDPKNKL